MDEEGLSVKEGSIVDATIVEVPKQRNSKEEKQTNKAGKIAFIIQIYKEIN